MNHLNQLLQLREEQYKFIEELRASNFSPDLFRDTYDGHNPQRYKAHRSFLRLKPEQRYTLTYNVGWAMRTVSWIRFQHTFKELKQFDPDFPEDLYNKMLDPNIPNESFRKLPSIEDIFQDILRKLEGVKTKFLNIIFQKLM